MAEESLAFYALVIAVMIAAGYDALTGAAIVLLGCGIGTFGSTINPFATGIASGFAGISISDGLVLAADHPDRRARPGHLLRAALRRPGQGATPPRSVVARHARGERGALQRRRRTRRRGRHDRPPARSILAVFGLAFVVMMYGVIPWEDLGIGLPTLWWWFPEMTASFILFSIIIGLIGRMSRGRAHRRVRRRRPRPARRRAHHRHRPRHHRGHEQRRDHRHRPALGRAGARRRRRGRLRDRDVPAVPAAVVPDPLVVGPGHRGDADHGARWRRSPASRPTWSSPRSRAPRG